MVQGDVRNFEVRYWPEGERKVGVFLTRTAAECRGGPVAFRQRAPGPDRQGHWGINLDRRAIELKVGLTSSKMPAECSAENPSEALLHICGDGAVRNMRQKRRDNPK